MDQPRTLDALTSQPVSSTIRTILAASRSQTVDGRPMVTIAGFLLTATITNPKNPTTAEVLRPLFGDPSYLSRFEEFVGPGIPNGAGEVTSSLWRAFEQAHSIRGRTHGKDAFIGLRHVVFAILTSNEPPILDDVTRLLGVLGVDRTKGVQSIASFCLRNLEKGENPKAWETILHDRGIHMDSLEGDSAPPTAVRDPEVALLQADDPWSGEVTDRSGASAEADAFAAMICASQFVPPLAVGVFGEWGSGKSFFMRLVYEAIVRRSSQPGIAAPATPPGATSAANRENPLTPSGTITFLRNVVQIRFNAWHYAETNLWASLVDHIFTSLDRWAESHNSASEAERLFEQLATARRLTVESAETLIQRRKERQEAADKLAVAQRDLQAKKDVLEQRPGTWLKTAWDELAGQPDQKKKLDEAAATLGLGDTLAGAEDLRSAAAGLDNALARYSIFRSATVRSLSLVPVVVAITAGILFLPPLLSWLSLKWNLGIAPVATTISGILAPLVVGLGWATKRTRDAIAVVNGFRSRLDAKVEALSKAEKQKAAGAEQELTAATAAADEAAGRLQLATDKVAEASRDYNISTGKGRVLRFVRERVANRDYEKHLSFVATVRKDFQELSDLMTAAAAPPDTERARKLHKSHVDALLAEGKDVLEPEEKAKLEATKADEAAPATVFDRIVLYIDDLDRCPPEKVVDVLQAIHLLLTFPLFVVFVAVDVRWLRHALEQTYPGQLEHDRPKETASPSDYLEKIFQIPYWVRPMSVESTRALLADRMGPLDAGQQQAPSIPSIPTPTLGRTGIGETPSGEGAGPSAMPPKTVSLRLTNDERDYINSLAEALDHSPRRTLRFINTYRIIKASLAADELYMLEFGGHRALLTLLALTVSGDQDLPQLLGSLGEGWPIRKSAGARVKGGRTPADLPPPLPEALDLFKGNGGKVGELDQYAVLVSRFSFEPTQA